MRKQSKKFIEASKNIDQEKQYQPNEALELVQKIAFEKFDPTVEVHAKLGIDPKKSDQLIRISVVLPHGVGKTKKVAVFAEGEKASEANAAGADIVGGLELIQEIKQTGKADFDVAVATPDMMKNLAVIAKVLGPRGLMPSPKNETVTTNIKQAVEQVKKGKVNIKNDDTGNIHQAIGKKSFGTEKLLENYTALIDILKNSKPSGAKGQFIRSLSISSTMGPSVKIQLP